MPGLASRRCAGPRQSSSVPFHGNDAVCCFAHLGIQRTVTSNHGKLFSDQQLSFAQRKQTSSNVAAKTADCLINSEMGI